MAEVICNFMELRIQCILNGFDTFGSRFVPIGKTVGTFCMWYVPVKCFLGCRGTKRWHFVPGGSFWRCRGTNKCHFVPVECVESLEGGRGNPDPPNGTYSGEVARITLYLFLLPMFIMFTTCSIGTVLSA